MSAHVRCSGETGGFVVGLGSFENVEALKLISNGGKETVTIRFDLFTIGVRQQTDNGRFGRLGGSPCPSCLQDYSGCFLQHQSLVAIAHRPLDLQMYKFAPERLLFLPSSLVNQLGQHSHWIAGLTCRALNLDFASCL